LAKNTEKQSVKEKQQDVHKKNLFQRPVFLFLSFLIFCVLFVVIFYIGKESAITNYNTANNAVPSIRNFGVDSKLTDIFVKFGALFGIGLGILMLLSLYIWYGIAAIFRLTKHRITVSIIMLLVYGFWFLFGLKLAFFENGFTTWANGIIYFTGRPLFYSTLIMVICAVGLLFLSCKKKEGKNE
jgi:hypothetical protein